MTRRPRSGSARPSCCNGGPGEGAVARDVAPHRLSGDGFGQVAVAAEVDGSGADRPVVRSEGYDGRVSCWSSMVLPAGSLIQI